MQLSKIGSRRRYFILITSEVKNNSYFVKSKSNFDSDVTYKFSKNGIDRDSIEYCKFIIKIRSLCNITL